MSSLRPPGAWTWQADVAGGLASREVMGCRVVDDSGAIDHFLQAGFPLRIAANRSQLVIILTRESRPQRRRGWRAASRNTCEIEARRARRRGKPPELLP